MKNILFFGGTGAHGGAVVRVLTATGQYRILIFTFDIDSPHCTALTSLPDVKAIVNPAKVGCDLATFEAAARGVYEVFLNTDGAVVSIHLEDYGRYIHWIFENPVRSIGQDIGIEIAHTTGGEIAAAFDAVTGKPAVDENILEATWAESTFSRRFPEGANTNSNTFLWRKPYQFLPQMESKQK